MNDIWKKKQQLIQLSEELKYIAASSMISYHLHESEYALRIIGKAIDAIAGINDELVWRKEPYPKCASCSYLSNRIELVEHNGAVNRMGHCNHDDVSVIFDTKCKFNIDCFGCINHSSLATDNE